jgi:hypothetical protein
MLYKICFSNSRSIMNPPKPSKDKESPGASSSSQVTFVRNNISLIEQMKY